MRQRDAERKKRTVERKERGTAVVAKERPDRAAVLLEDVGPARGVPCHLRGVALQPRQDDVVDGESNGEAHKFSL